MGTGHQHVDLLEGFAREAPAIYWETDANGIVTVCEGGALGPQGLTQRDVLGKSVFDLYRDYPEFLRNIRLALSGERNRAVLETFGVLHDRVLQPIHDATGAVTGMLGISIDVSTHDRLYAYARQVEAQFRALVEGSLQGIVVHREGKILFSNRAYAQLLGRSAPSDLLGMPIMDTVAPHDRERLTDIAVRRSRGEPVPEQYETDLVRADGKEVSALVLVKTVDWHGTPATQSTVIDISDRKRAEKDLLRREQQFRDLIDGSLQGILIRRGAKPLFVNHVWAHLHRFASPQAALEFGSVVPFMTPAGAEQMRATDAELLRTRIPVHELVARTRLDGSSMLLEQSKRVVDWDGEPAIQVTVIDATERQRAERELRASQKLLQSVMDALPIHVFVKDLESRYVLANRAFAAFYGISQEDLHRSTVLDLPLTPEQQAAIRADDQRVMESRQPLVEPEKRIATRDGRVMICHSTKLPLVDERGAVIGLLGVGIDISEMKQAEAARHQNEQVYQQIHDAVIATDLDGRVILWSPGAERMYGYTPQEVMGRTLGMLWPEDVDGEANQQSLYRDLQETGHLQVRVRRRRKSGEIFHVSVSLGFLKDEHGIPYGIVGTSTDVSEMIRAENALRQSEEQYRALIEDSPHGIAIFRFGPVEFANAACVRMLGYANAEELMAVPSVDDIVAPVDRGRMRIQRERRAAGETVPEQYDVVLLRRDGTTMNVIATSRVIQWRGDTAIQTTLTDITARKLAEDTLREKEWFLSRAQRAGQIGTWFRPIGSDRIHWSEETYRISGVNPATFVPSLQANLELIHPDDRAAFLENRRRVTELGQNFSDEYRIVRPDGQIRHVQMVGELLTDAAGKPAGVIGIIQDITDRKVAETQALQAQKIEAVGRLTAGIAHDFNNLLTVIRGNLELGLNQLPPDDRLRNLLGAVLAAADRGSGLIHQLSAFTRRQPLHPEVIDVTPVLEEIVGLLEHTLGSQVEIVTALPKPGWAIRVDRAQFDNAILNLAINARDAMPDGGRLTLSVEHSHVAAGADALHPGIAPGEYVIVSLADTGTGILPELREKIFEPFFTTKPLGKGTGLGLSMVMGFVRQSGGNVVVESAIGRGSTLRLFFPRWLEAPARAEQPPARPLSGAVPVSGATVLIVEDRAEIRTLAGQIFEAMGFKPLAADDGPQALEVLKKHPDVALLFTDVMLPHGMSGVDIAKEARRRNPRMAILITTGFAEDTIDLSELIDQGALFVEKPYRISDIRARLEQLHLLQPAAKR